MKKNHIEKDSEQKNKEKKNHKKVKLVYNSNFEFNPEMLTLARGYHSLTKKGLADLIGVNPSFITHVEDGLKKPSEQTLEKLVEKLGFPAGHYFQEGRMEAAMPYRRRMTIPKKTMTTCNAKLCLFKKAIAKLLEGVDAEDAKLPRIDPDETIGGVPKVAEMIRRALRIPSGPIRNLMGILEEFGVILIPFDFGTLKIDGCSTWITGYPIIFFNPNVPRSRLRHTLSHELAHLVMHDFVTGDKEEDEADLFAGCFNMPKDDIRHQLIPLNMARLANLKAYWKSSMAAILYRAKDLEMITERQHRYFCMNLNKQRQKNGEETNEDQIPVEIPKAFRELFSVYKEELGLRPEEIQEHLMIPMSAFNELIPRNGYLRAI